jgi:RNA polymerase sigma-70 factor (ECF subfamily)
MVSKLFLLLEADFSSLKESTQEEIYREFYLLVFKIGIHFTRDHVAAEDIVQEAFIKMIYHAPRFNDENHLIAWIRTVTRNLTLNMLKKTKRLGVIEDIQKITQHTTHPQEPVDKEIEAKILEEEITHGLAEINPEYRKIIILTRDNTKKELSRKMNRSVCAISQKLYRARKALRKRVQKRGYFDESG